MHVYFLNFSVETAHGSLLPRLLLVKTTTVLAPIVGSKAIDWRWDDLGELPWNYDPGRWWSHAMIGLIDLRELLG